MDKFISIAIEGYIKNKFGKYLPKSDLKVNLNTSAKECSLEATLAGDDLPTTIRIKKYEVCQLESGAKCIKIAQVECSKEWLNLALNDFLKDKNIPLPSFAASVF